MMMEEAKKFEGNESGEPDVEPIIGSLEDYKQTIEATIESLQELLKGIGTDPDADLEYVEVIEENLKALAKYKRSHQGEFNK